MRITYGEAIDLVNELQREWGTHLHAATQGWSFTATYGEVLALVHAQAFIAWYRDPKRPLVSLPAPWDGAEETVTADERAALTAQLERRSAFAH